MVNYFLILGLNTSATERDIKLAYRKLAMRYHPDRNKSSGAKERFIQVNEAYEFLSDPQLRIQHRKQLSNRVNREDLLRRREQLYRQWAEQQRQEARKRAARNAETSFDKFTKSPIYKTAMVLSNVYNYVFFGIGLLIICAPLFKYFGSSPEELRKDPLTFGDVLIPVFIGGFFTYGIYHFLFKNNPDKPVAETSAKTRK
ncbi:J domain-containing protein [Halocola ammonii]